MKYLTLDQELISKYIDELLFIIKDEIDEYWTLENFLYPLPKKFEFSVIAIQNEQVCGFIVASLKGSLVHIHKFMAHPNHRGEGVGTDMLSHFVDTVSQYSKGITLKVYDVNVAAHRFYLKNNFYFGRKDGRSFEMFRSLKPSVVGVHQPNFLPWIGYFSKIKNSDFFVLLDTVQYTKNSYINRVQLPGNDQASWMTVPVVKPELSTQIKDVSIAVALFKVKKQVKRIAQSYAKAPFFKEVFPVVERLMLSEVGNLATFNGNLIRGLCVELGIKTAIVTASAMKIDFDSNVNATARLIAICQKFNTTVYLSGTGGFNYQDQDQFKEHGIDVRPVGFEAYEYERYDGNEFLAGMSIVDALFNEGFQETYKKL